MAESRSAEHIRTELEGAQAELQELLGELGNLDVAEKEAIEEDHDERLKAATKGGRIRDALKRRRSKVAEIADRRAELPYEIYAARVRVAELRKDEAEAMLPQAEQKVEETQKALGPADEKFAKAQAEHKRVHDEYGSALQERMIVENAKRDAELELQRLNGVGPGVASAPIPESPNAL